MIRRALPLLALLAAAAPALTQEPTFDPEALFGADLLAGPEQPTRSVSGAPGPDYWQNRADYRVAVTLDPEARRLEGTAELTYTNESPDALDFLWLLLPQNRFQEGSRSAWVAGGARDDATGGFELAEVSVTQGDETYAVTPEVSDTRCQLWLRRPVAPGGGQVRVRLAYRYELPRSGRSGVVDTERGPVFEVAMWYPKVAVYDDVRGWNALPFLGSGEFYLDFGDVTYEVTVPRDYLVVGSGALQNPEEVLTAEQRERLAAAGESRETVFVRAPDEVGDPATRPGGEGPLTWRFAMEETRDVAWAASPAFVWDAARIDLPSGRTALAMSAYPPEVAGAEGWGPSTRYVQATIERYSRELVEYPWPAAVSVGGRVGGMEWPGLVFNSWKAKGYTLFFLSVHEHGHQWFPMIVGSDERRHPWMDEGLNSFVNVDAHEDLEEGAFAPKRDGEYAPQGGNPARELVAYLTHPEAQPILAPTPTVPREWFHHLYYYKPALGLVLLREVVVGPGRFDRAMQEYARRWAFKHPRPVDFFRTLNDVTGEDLSWFWKGWFAEGWLLDQRVDDVRPVDGDWAQGARIVLGNRRRFAMPVEVRIEEEDGDVATVRLPVEVWAQGARYAFRHRSDSPVVRVTLDPDERLPDVVRDNNTWSAGPRR